MVLAVFDDYEVGALELLRKLAVGAADADRKQYFFGFQSDYLLVRCAVAHAAALGQYKRRGENQKSDSCNSFHIDNFIRR